MTREEEIKALKARLRELNSEPDTIYVDVTVTKAVTITATVPAKIKRGNPDDGSFWYDLNETARAAVKKHFNTIDADGIDNCEIIDVEVVDYSYGENYE